MSKEESLYSQEMRDKFESMLERSEDSKVFIGWHGLTDNNRPIFEWEGKIYFAHVLAYCMDNNIAYTEDLAPDLFHRAEVRPLEELVAAHGLLGTLLAEDWFQQEESEAFSQMVIAMNVMCWVLGHGSKDNYMDVTLAKIKAMLVTDAEEAKGMKQ